MEFTPEQEQMLIEKNMTKIYRAVDNYTARCSRQIINIPYEDFVQEVTLALLLYLRKCKTNEELNRFPWFDAMCAMRDYVLSAQPVRCSKHRNRFSETVHSMPLTISLDGLRAKTGIEIDGMSKHWMEDKEAQIDFDSFMDEQPENIRRIASMRVYGMTMKEIGDQCGVSKGAICKKLNKLGDAYKNYMEDAENA